MNSSVSASDSPDSQHLYIPFLHSVDLLPSPLHLLTRLPCLPPRITPTIEAPSTYHKIAATMHWDAFCAICGSTFAYSFTLPISFDDNSKLSYSKKVIGNSDLQWLSKLRALGYNASSTTERKSVITLPQSPTYSLS